MNPPPKPTIMPLCPPGKTRFTAQFKRLNPVRTGLRSVMDYLDTDDHVSVGGQA
jgi:hypothetical protein